ncbi:uncharacterized protein N7459_009210 [Penicillium hispanicum]|uniref:uncharacterized protein n=1 Tax=Penicillium hispanicum TaxID=1080232 RepID=UPI00253FE51B|nr:uncharacterized protein N7459_009210 [Penicillium hispanicum]KAJ5569780.1 hypothetical protein N7459_009210 [Penicillium hispanicum]
MVPHTSNPRHRPTESLILPNKRRFIPLKIPNFHPQLRHYISTADPDRIYVVVDRVIYAIHVSAQRRESIAVIPFEPRCLAAGHGWIAVGGPDNGECAYIRIDGRGLQVHSDIFSRPQSDVDSALPLDLEPPSRLSSPGASSGATSARRSPRRGTLPELSLHRFGGSIVNSVTIHRFPGNHVGVSDEDVLILSNNDRTVTIYSLTRAKVLKILHHATCMNYATISPDRTLLAAVGDENRAYFYEISRDWEALVTIESGERLAGWNWELVRCVEMDIGQRLDDACCFTIAFSPSSLLCAIGSQSGIITVLDVDLIHRAPEDMKDESFVVCQFPSSRPCAEGGAVRCMTFSPGPWDLLVWLEGHGRAGVADVRQAFTRRQTVHLDLDDPLLHEVHVEPVSEEAEGARVDDDDELDIAPRVRLSGFGGLTNEGGGEDHGRSSLRENLIQDLSERERLIMEFLNTARWPSRLEEGHTERPERSARETLHPHPASRTRYHGSTDGTTQNSRPTSPPHLYDSSDIARDSRSGRMGAPERSYHARRQSSVVLSQGRRSSEVEVSNIDHQPTIAPGWTTSPSEIQSTGSDIASRGADPDLVSHENGMEPRPPEAIGPSPPALELGVSPESLSRLRSQRSNSTPRRSERPPTAAERRYDTSRLSTYEIRANLAAERLRRQRQIPEVHNRSLDREQRHRQQLLGFEQAHSPRWIRNIINELPDRSLVHGSGAEEPDASAGLGWGADGRTLYIATLEGIFEFQLNVHDRKTFPVFSYR